MVWKFIDGTVTCTLDVWNMTCMVYIELATIYNITTLKDKLVSSSRLSP